MSILPPPPSSAGVPNSYYTFAETFGNRALSVPLTVGWAREERDNPLVPTRGRYQRINLDFSLAGDVHYARLNAQYQQYFAVTSRLTLGVNGELGLGYGLGGKPYPLFKNFYGGGLGSVRVFEQGSFGGVDITGAYDGGSKKVNINSELYFPVPGSGNDKSLRIFAFADAGNVWRDGYPMDLDTLRASAGVGLSWISPVGPLKLSYGTPLRSFKGDKIQRFQFQVGTAF